MRFRSLQRKTLILHLQYGASAPCNLVSKVRPNFAYLISREPIVVPDCKTTLFHAHFDFGVGGDEWRDQVQNYSLPRAF
ncbi:hypothetical protein FF2_033593 [Malus domestica]